MCCSQVPCHWNIPVSYRDTKFLSSSSFRKASLLLFFDNMLCLLVPFHCFALNCVFFMPNSSPQVSAALTGTRLEMSPGSLLLKGIAILSLSLWSVTGGAVFEKSAFLFPGVPLLCSHHILPTVPITIRKCYSAYVGSTEVNQEEGRKKIGVVSR